MPGSSVPRRGPAASSASPPPQVSVFPSPQELGSALAQLVAQREAQSGPAGRFSLGLSGGSLVRILSQELPAAAASPARWLVAFVDERRVPLEDPESNYGAYKVCVCLLGRECQAGGPKGELEWGRGRVGLLPPVGLLSRGIPSRKSSGPSPPLPPSGQGARFARG